MSASNQPPARHLRARHRREKAFRWLCLAMTCTALVLLIVLLVALVGQGARGIDWDFLTSYPSRRPSAAGIKSALAGTLWVMVLTALLSVPLGVAAAVYLEEYAGRNRLNSLIAVNIANLAGVPSIVYGMLGLALFVRGIGLGRSVLAGALTLTMLILPVIIIASREAIRAVPGTLRQAAYALGATRWQTIRDHVLPAALPGVMTSVILALSRAIGETAPLIMVGALSYVAFVPTSLRSEFVVMPIQIFNWASRPQEAFHALAASAILVLLAMLLSMNAVAVSLRHRTERKHSW
ncbi:MAG: phosphate ABC transporter permease PstA [Armatimonadetes bacterium]|nr:phosphate ABC transporter permease PstA [Armatimonadota bacterium]